MKTLREKYNAIQKGEYSKTQFIKEARMELPNLISPNNSYSDIVNILKNKNFIKEVKTLEYEKPHPGVPLENVERGVDYELEAMGINTATETPTEEEYQKALKKVNNNLDKDPNYYLHLLSGDSKKVDKHDQFKEYKDKDKVDTFNGLKKADLKENYEDEDFERISREVEYNISPEKEDYENEQLENMDTPVDDTISIEKLLKVAKLAGEVVPDAKQELEDLAVAFGENIPKYKVKKVLNNYDLSQIKLKEAIGRNRGKNEMKHPGYPSSKQTNQYAQRAGNRLSKAEKDKHKEEMSNFTRRLEKILAKKKNIQKDVNEVEITDPDFTENIETFYNLQEEINQLKQDLKDKQSEYGKFKSTIDPVISSMKDLEDKLGETEGYILKVKKFDYERTSSSYKDAFELALSKVNGSTRRVLEEALKTTQKVSTVKASYSIEKIQENKVLDKIRKVLSKVVNRFLSIFNKEERTIDSANSKLRQITSRANSSNKVKEGIHDRDITSASHTNVGKRTNMSDIEDMIRSYKYSSKLLPILKKYNVKIEDFIKMAETDQLTKDELMDFGYVEDRIEAHLSHRDSYDDLGNRLKEGRRPKMQGGKTIKENDYESGGYVETMQPQLDIAIDRVLKVWEKWKKAPMTEPGMIPYAKKDLVDYFSNNIEQAILEAEKADKDYDKDGKIETPEEEYLGSRNNAIKSNMNEKSEEKLKKIFKKAIVNILSEDKKSINEASTENLEEFLHYENEDNEDLASRIRKAAAELEDIVGSLEKDHINVREKVEKIYKDIGSFMAPAVAAAFKKDLEPVLRKLHNIEVPKGKRMSREEMEELGIDPTNTTGTVFSLKENKKGKKTKYTKRK